MGAPVWWEYEQGAHQERHREQQRGGGVEAELDVRAMEPDRLSLVERVVEGVGPVSRGPQHVDDAVDRHGHRGPHEHPQQAAQHAGAGGASDERRVDERPGHVDVEHLERPWRAQDMAAQHEEHAEGGEAEGGEQHPPVEQHAPADQRGAGDARQRQCQEGALERPVGRRHEEHREEEGIAHAAHRCTRQTKRGGGGSGAIEGGVHQSRRPSAGQCGRFRF